MEGVNQVNGEATTDAPSSSGSSEATRAIHADDHLSRTADVAPPLHVSSTYRYGEDPEKLVPVDQWDIFKHTDQTPTDTHIYSRVSNPNTTRLEALLSSLMGGRAITYTSGLAAMHALFVHLNPRRVAISGGYHGVHGLMKIHQKLSGMQKVDLHGTDANWDAAGLGSGDVVHVETPLNPTGEAHNLAAFAERAHARGAYLTVDATFAPPPLQAPFAHGADVVMYSGTKYLGGHSDMLCGVLVVKRDDWWWQLFGERLLMGGVMGSMEGWLGLRSMRTLDLRIRRQSENATELVRRLDEAISSSVSTSINGETSDHGAENTESSKDRADAAVVQAAVEKITHASLQVRRDPKAAIWLLKQMPNGFGPVFSLWLRSSQMARALPSKLQYFHHATSLGGVESLVEWRRMSDASVSEQVLRFSIGIEGIEDLWQDLVAGMKKVLSWDGSGSPK